MTPPDLGTILVGIVGPCGAGKSTLADALQARGYLCRHIAQEHSYVPYMWQRITDPDVLIYLHASFRTCTSRRQLAWSEDDYQEQLRRLEHARQHANLHIETDALSPQGVCSRALYFLESFGLPLTRK